MSVTELEPNPPPVLPPQDSLGAAIHTEGLSKRYGSTLALDRLDLTVGRDEVYGYLGPNGSGKTTTIRLLLGLHHPTAGQAQLFGHDAWRDPVAAHRTSHTSQASRFYGRR
jgi:ABC-type multidrug transport system ATPase subunit